MMVSLFLVEERRMTKQLINYNSSPAPECINPTRFRNTAAMNRHTYCYDHNFVILLFKFSYSTYICMKADSVIFLIP